jgi:hypothetical protein
LELKVAVMSASTEEESCCWVVLGITLDPVVGYPHVAKWDLPSILTSPLDEARISIYLNILVDF